MKPFTLPPNPKVWVNMSAVPAEQIAELKERGLTVVPMDSPVMQMQRRIEKLEKKAEEK